MLKNWLCWILLMQRSWVYIYIYIYIYIYTHIYILYIHTHICIYMNIHTHTHAWINIYIHTHMSIPISTHKNIDIYTHKYTDTCIYTHTHTHTHTWIYISRHSNSTDSFDSCHPSLSAIALGRSSGWDSVSTMPMNVSFCWSSNTGVSMCRSPWDNIANEFLLTYPACLVHFTWMVCKW